MKDATDRRAWKVRTFVCEACRQSAIAQSLVTKQDESLPEFDADGARPSDGRGVWVVPPDTPDEEG